MGTYISKDTRRISFDNNFALSSPIPLQKSIEAENAMALNNLPPVSLNRFLIGRYVNRAS